MPSQVSVLNVATRDDYGKPLTYQPAQVFQCRISFKLKRIASRVTGQDTLAAGTIWLMGIATGIEADTRVVMPDGSTPKLVSWGQTDDENGPLYTVLYLGAT